ncbi:MAG: hypothetical protein ACLFUS_16650 [Candidatus Sumerlaeia bacterium]
MKAIFKLLMAFEVADDPAARKKFQQVLAQLEPYLPENAEIRDCKMVEDGTGRLLDKMEADA